MPIVADLREKARTAAAEAKAFIENGEVEPANKASEEGEKLLTQIAELVSADDRAKALEGKFNDPDASNSLPVTKVEAGLQKLEGGKADYTNDYEPANWIKGLSAAIQPVWVRGKMGADQKSKALFYQNTWTKWFRARR